MIKRISELPGVERVAVGTVVPWRDAGTFGPGFQFSAEGYSKVNGEEDPRARFRTVSPGFFAALGVPIVFLLMGPLMVEGSYFAITGVSVTGPSRPQSVSGQFEASKGL